MEKWGLVIGRTGVSDEIDHRRPQAELLDALHRWNRGALDASTMRLGSWV
jgi:hypothetical protein